MIIRLYPNPETSEVAAESTDLAVLLALPATDGARIVRNGVVLARARGGVWETLR